MTWNDVEVFSGLRRSTPIYRIVDFFSVAHIVTSSSLYIPLAERLKDPNEGIDAALRLHEVSTGPCAGIARFFNDSDEFKEYQQQQKRTHYISCWSQVRESVAMWALYSTDLSSVQITTTVGQLVDALRSYCGGEHDPRSAIEDSTKKGQFVESARVVPIKYLSILDLSARIDRRRRAYDKLESKGLIRERVSEEWSVRDRARMIQYELSAFELKDASFSHEMELRGIIEAVPYDIEMLKIAKKELFQKVDSTELIDPKYERGVLRYARAILREERIKRQLAALETLFLPLPRGFITQVSIDPRCDLHKQEFMNTFFRENGIPVIPSRCFGHAANMISVQPRSKLLTNIPRP